MAEEGAGGEQSVSFELTLDDLVATSRYVTPELRSGRRIRDFITACVIVFLALLFFLGRGTPKVCYIVVPIGLVFLYVMFPKSPRKALQAQYRANPRTLGGRVVRIEAEGLSVGSDDLRNIYRWHTVRKVETDSLYAFVYLLEKQVLPIPRRAFPDEAAFEAFLAEIRRRAAEFQQPAREVR